MASEVRGNIGSPPMQMSVALMGGVQNISTCNISTAPVQKSLVRDGGGREGEMRGRYYHTNLQGRSQSESSHYHLKKKKRKKTVLPDLGWHMGHEDLLLISSFKS